MSAKEPLLRVEDLCMYFSSKNHVTRAAQNVSIEINEGETPNIGVETSVSTNDEGTTEVNTNIGIDMDGNGTMSSETNNEGNVSSDKKDL